MKTFKWLTFYLTNHKSRIACVFVSRAKTKRTFAVKEASGPREFFTINGDHRGR